MPSKKTRINLTVDDDLNELLTALSKIDGKPKATLIVDILEQMRPHFKELIKAMELVEQKKAKTDCNERQRETDGLAKKIGLVGLFH